MAPGVKAIVTWPFPGDGTEEKWNALMKRWVEEVNRMKFTQHPDLGEMLRSTKKAELGAIEPEDYLLGIGFSADEPEAKMKDRWTGQNELGKALMKIRGELQAAAPKKRPTIVTRSAALPAASTAASTAASAEVMPAPSAAPSALPAPLMNAPVAIVPPAANGQRIPRRRPPITQAMQPAMQPATQPI